jgi:flagellar hook-basal body complex protein FliE
MPIDPLVGAIQPLTSPAGAVAPAAAEAGFGASLERLVARVENTAAKANQAVGQMLDGSGDVHDAMIAMQRADLTLQLTVQVRNKLVQAYQDIMRMPV